MEEVSSFWRPGLNWRAFFAAAVSNFTVLAVLGCVQNDEFKCGELKKSGLIDFVGHPGSEIGVFDMVNFFCFVVLGICGGLIGAAFNHINVVVTKLRNKTTNLKPYTKLLEVLVICTITITVEMLVPFAYNSCVKSPCNGDDETCKNVVHYGRFTCDEGEYNPMASLLQPPRESIIEGLFYYQDAEGSTVHEFYPNGALWIGFLCYFVVAVITYGIGIPSGLSFLFTFFCG